MVPFLGQLPPLKYAFVITITVNNYTIQCFTWFILGHSSPGNVALNKPAYQISTSSAGVPSRAVDGSRNPVWGDGSCTHTKNHTSPWWMVDLGEMYDIGNVKITNRYGQGKYYDFSLSAGAIFNHYVAGD